MCNISHSCKGNQGLWYDVIWRPFLINGCIRKLEKPWKLAPWLLVLLGCWACGVAGTIAPAREVPAFGAGDLPIYLNLNLIVPVVSAVVVIVLAIVIICYLRGRNTPIKGMIKIKVPISKAQIPSLCLEFFFKSWWDLLCKVPIICGNERGAKERESDPRLSTIMKVEIGSFTCMLTLTLFHSGTLRLSASITPITQKQVFITTEGKALNCRFILTSTSTLQQR